METDGMIWQSLRCGERVEADLESQNSLRANCSIMTQYEYDLNSCRNEGNKGRHLLPLQSLRRI
jgi:hypothetical protein